MNAPPPREQDELLAVFDLRTFMRVGQRRLQKLAGLYLETVVERLDAGVTFAPGAPIVVCAVVEGQIIDSKIVDRIDARGFDKDAEGMPLYPVGAMKARVYLTLHATQREKPKPEWVLLHERDDGTRFYLITKGEAVARVFTGNLEVPFGLTDETERWLVCAPDLVSEECERLAKESFEQKARSPAMRILKALVSRGYEVNDEALEEVLGVGDVDR